MNKTKQLCENKISDENDLVKRKTFYARLTKKDNYTFKKIIMVHLFT